MKEQYDAPKTEVILLEEENIILTSGENEYVNEKKQEGAGISF